MPKFAHFNPRLPVAPIEGWYDTDTHEYARLPRKATLFAMTPEQWDNRMTGHWAVENGALVPYERPVPPVVLPVGTFLRRLHDIGELEAFLARMPTHDQALFYTRPAPIAADDPDVIQRLLAIDVDPTTIFTSAAP